MIVESEVSHVTGAAPLEVGCPNKHCSIIENMDSIKTKNDEELFLKAPSEQLLTSAHSFHQWGGSGLIYYTVN